MNHSSGAGPSHVPPQVARGERPQQIVHPDWVWVDGRLERGRAVGIDAQGRIASIAPISGPSTLRLPGKALIPGFVSAHSHAFQRGLRGATERFAAAGEFFRWREAMYALVERLTPDLCYELSRETFAEMLTSGITSVGEFHYVRHHLPKDGSEGSEDLRYAFDASVLAAAKDAGIRMTLLHTCYMQGGFGTPLAGGQIRFRTRDERDYWDRFDRLVASAHPATQAIGATAHSVRAVPIDAIQRLHAESVRRGCVFHMHVEEVRKEIEDCMAAHGKRPMQLLLDRLAIDRRFTAVHCTHTSAEDLARFAQTGATVCLCPLTEGNLGDGICDVATIRRSRGAIAFGSDLNSRLAPTEELRWIEYVQRVRHEMRGAVIDANGDCGAALLSIGTSEGARSIGVDAGEIAVGKLADFALVDLQHATMLNWTPETFASHLIFGAGTSAVCGVCVGGAWRIRR
ncbi:MAG: formimidoylglutamate deiminase [Phycisphaerae bacterium]|nr:formimidoylglutamate deiminase [Phycisphaerae bacterium]